MNTIRRPDISPELLRQHRVVRESACLELDRRYGPDSNSPFFYHDSIHTVQDVVPAVDEIATEALRHGVVSPAVLAITKTAAYFHDIVQELGPGDNEEKSAEILLARMNQPDVPLLNGEPAQFSADLVRSTKVEFTPKDIIQDVIGGAATREKIFASQLLCDADLSNLGMPFGEHAARVMKLHREQVLGITEADERQASLLTLIEFQVELLNEHSWCTGALAAYVRPHKKLNAAKWSLLLRSPGELSNFLNKAA